MLSVLLGLLSSFEVGFWTKSILDLRGSRRKARELLIEGEVQPIRVPYFDRRFERSIGTPTKSQERIAGAVTRLARWGMGTRAFELAVLRFVRGQWPVPTDELDEKVKLCL